jgi:hypothetical protein
MNRAAFSFEAHRQGYIDGYTRRPDPDRRDTSNSYGRGLAEGSRDMLDDKPPRFCSYSLFRKPDYKEPREWLERQWADYVRGFLDRHELTKLLLSQILETNNSTITKWTNGQLPYRSHLEQFAKLMDGPATLIAAGFVPDLRAYQNFPIVDAIETIRAKPWKPCCPGSC